MASNVTETSPPRSPLARRASRPSTRSATCRRTSRRDRPRLPEIIRDYPREVDMFWRVSLHSPPPTSRGGSRRSRPSSRKKLTRGSSARYPPAPPPPITGPLPPRFRHAAATGTPRGTSSAPPPRPRPIPSAAEDDAAPPSSLEKSGAVAFAVAWFPSPRCEPAGATRRHATPRPAWEVDFAFTIPGM